MASTGKPTAVHFSLIFFVMLSIILGVMFFLELRHVNENEAAWAKAQEDLKAAERLAREQDESIQLLKRYIGYVYDEVGAEGGGKATVIGAIEADLARVGDLPEQSYKAAVAKLLEDVKNLTSERDSLQAKLDQEHKAFLALQQQYEAKVQEHTKARAQLEKELQDLTAKMDEQLRSKQRQIEEQVARVRQLRAQLEDERLANEKLVKRLQQEITDLQHANDLLTQKLDNATKVSFEHPDGVIRYVDYSSRTVVINLGHADGLRERTTFAVYTQDHHGVARGQDDIKGAIEVINVVDAHSAVCRILEDNMYRPILPGDPIYTPLWSPGRSEVFSFVGIIDLDGDGVSDRQDLHDLIASVGGEIDNEVLDDGRRIFYTAFPKQYVEFDEESGQTGLSLRTKFLVIGKIPNINDAATKEQKDQYANIRKHLNAMIQEARRQGVRIVNLNDFLSWIGYKPKRRLHKPGETETYTLKAGARSTAVDETVGERESSGSVSGVYSRSRRLRQPVSSGQTSKLFHGGGGY